MSLIQQAKDYRDGKTDLLHVRKSKRARIIRMAEKLTVAVHAEAYNSGFDGYPITDGIQEAIDALELIEDGEDYDVPMEEEREDFTDTTND